jgi:hypothetical protein
MAHETFLREATQHCEAVLAVLADAGLPAFIPPGATPVDAWVLLRPTLQILRVPWRDHRWIEVEVRNDPQHYPWVLAVHPATQRRSLWVELRPFLLLAGFRGRHAVCTTYGVWYCGVTSALMAHGWYDPATGHTPPPGEELNALECREEGRDLFNTIMPGMGDVLSGHRLQTEEGRCNIWYCVVDDEGQKTLINGMDMPNDEEEEEDA